LEKAGQAEPFRAPDRRTLGRLTEAGRVAVANGPGAGDDEVTTEPHTDDVDPATDDAATTLEADEAAPPHDAPGERPETADEDTTVTPTGEADEGVTTGEQDPRGAASHDDEDTNIGQPGTAASPTGEGEEPHEPQAPARQNQTSSAARDTTAADNVLPDMAVSTGDSEPPVSPSSAALAPVNDGTDDSEPDAGDATEPDGSETPQPDGQAPPDSGDTPKDARSGHQRRAKGALRGAVVDILENNPDRQYKVGELCKLINQGEQGSGMPKASAGAVANVLDKLAGAGIAVQTVAKPATFQLASRED
jgi:hypothetical protein